MTGTRKVGYESMRSEFLELFKVVCVKSRTQPRGLAQQLGDMPLVFGRIVFGGGFEVARQLCAVVERPELFKDYLFAFSDFEGGTQGIGDVGIECLVDFVIFLFH